MIVVRLLLRFLIVPLGACVAFCVAAAIVLFAQWDKLIAALANQGAGDNFWFFIFVVGPIYLLVWLAIALYSMLPAAIGVVISEGFAIRHWAFHAVNGALSVWIGSALMSQGDKGTEYLDAPVLVVGAGIAAGFAYWAVAGWSAGFWKPVFAQPVPAQTAVVPRPPAAQA